jgi:hypothetical protein
MIKILIIFVFLPTLLFGQKYKTAFIIAKADSIINNYLGDSLFTYVKYDTKTYYEYKTISGKLHKETLNKIKKTKGTFVSVNMRWFLEIPYPDCPILDTIRGMTFLMLDSNLKPTNKPNLEFIPDFYWSKSNCNFITRDKALTIAKGQILKRGIDPIEINIEYNFTEKKYLWIISNYLTKEKDFQNTACGEVELVRIDAISGKIMEHETTWYGPIH